MGRHPPTYTLWTLRGDCAPRGILASPSSGTAPLSHHRTNTAPHHHHHTPGLGFSPHPHRTPGLPLLHHPATPLSTPGATCSPPHFPRLTLERLADPRSSAGDAVPGEGRRCQTLEQGAVWRHGTRANILLRCRDEARRPGDAGPISGVSDGDRLNKRYPATPR